MLHTIKEHSKLGIASCTIAIATFLLMTILLLANNFVDRVTDDPQYIGDLSITTWVAAGFILIPTHFVGFVLGAIGLFLPNRRKFYSVFGTVLNLVLGIGSIWPWLYFIWAGLGRVQ